MRRVMIVLLTLLCVCSAVCALAGESAKKPKQKMFWRVEKQSLVVSVNIAGLKPDASYVLCINGKVGKPGNETLKQYGIWKDVGYWDFATTQADSNGRLEFRTSVPLPSGNYDIFFILKDVGDNWNWAYTKDNMRFSIHGE